MCARKAEPQEKAEQLVVVGASAGGIDALSVLVSTLPAGLPAPVLIAQHLDPSRPSHLQEILQRRSVLPVRSVDDHEPLEPATVFVVPSNQQVAVTDHEVRVKVDTGSRPQPSVDLLFASAAQVYGERLIAVILTGTGSDGAAGARAVKAEGGTVVIQNPETAAYPGMPRSLAPTSVDIVAELDQIGPILGELLDGARRPDEDGLTAFLEELRTRTGIDFGGYRRGTIRRRLRSRIAASGVPDLEAYLRRLETDPREYERLTSSFLIKVTEFFRDPALFTYLRGQLPDMLHDGPTGAKELRIWSAGCATGEETYSLAMLVADVLGDRLATTEVRIFGTDLDAAAVEYARRGLYPPQALRQLPGGYLDRFFVPSDGGYEVSKAIRALTVFGQHDLAQRAPFPRMDLVSCRNVLMYFTPQLQERALRLFAFALREGGRLVLGKAETTKPLSNAFKLEESRLRIYRRRGGREKLPPLSYGEQVSLPTQPLHDRRTRRGELDAAVLRSRREGSRRRAAADQAEGLLHELNQGIVVLRRRYDIVRINASARRMLSVHGVAVGEDFVHLATGLPSNALRGAIDRAFAGETTTDIHQLSTADSDAGALRHLRVRSAPHRSDGVDGPVDQVVIELTDVSEMLADQHLLAEQQAAADRLGATNRQLVAANDELAEANLVLRSTNEELLLAHEEVQASAEEIETLNEELQASNEELETLNEELQASLEELHTANTDLESRGEELQAMARTVMSERELSESERARLAATLAAMDDAVVMVDEHGEAKVSNLAYDRLFSGLQGAFPADEGGTPIMLSEAQLRRRAAAGDRFQLRFTLAEGDGRRWYEASGAPLGMDGSARGGIVSIHDLTDLSLRVLQEEFVAVISHELRTPLTALAGYLQLLRRRLGSNSDATVDRYLAQASRQSGRMSQLIGDLFDVSRLQHGTLDYDFQPVELSELAEQTVELAALLDGGAEVNLKASAGPMLVVADPGRLQQVMLNLLTNAIRHSGTERIEMSLRRRQQTAVLRVRDEGRGIPPDQLKHLFTRFYDGQQQERRSGGGLGLGLYICREIVRAHGGTIAVRSPSGRGTTVTVRLPLQADADAP
jgi:two-component system CheB/CheR fusion protein